MSLPREIRDNIYRLALISPSPIIVWKGELVYESRLPLPGTWRRVIDQSATKSSLSLIVTNLLFSTKTISREAADVFYHSNTFSFLGHHNWDPVASWLQAIGALNRNLLINLEINAYKPNEVWQRFNGERVKHPGGSLKEPIYLRNPYLGVSMRPFKYGLVDNINPALETIFELLGRRTSMQKVILNLKLGREYPGQGAIYEEGDQCPESNWHSMDLPNLVEKFRSLHTYRSGESHSEPMVDLFWTGESCLQKWHRQGEIVSRVVILDHLQNIKDHGWEIDISPMEEDATEWKPHDESRNIPTYVLRRKLVEPLMAHEPNPYSGIYIQVGSEESFMEEVTGWYPV